MKKKKFMVTLEINGLFDHEVQAENLEEALKAAKNILPRDVIRLKSTKRSGIVDWETRNISSVFEA